MCCRRQVEERIVAQLLESPELMALIDDFFWEHHVNFKPMANVWLVRDQATGIDRTMEDSIKLFDALRRAGVRAHSWI